MNRPRRRTVGVALLVVVVALASGAAWYLQPQPLLPEATVSLATTEEVAFAIEDDRLTWTPTDTAPTTGLIVYPGGKVPAAAYGPLAREIASAGYLVTIVPMPLNLAVLGIGRADEVITAHPDIDHWAIGGHSLGGSMAAQYAADHPGIVSGLAFWASYGTMDLSSSGLAVLSTWGSLDAGAGRMGGPEARSMTPPNAVFVEIDGGNHEQMGWYTGQPNDPPAAISRQEQQALVAAATVDLLRALGN